MVLEDSLGCALVRREAGEVAREGARNRRVIWGEECEAVKGVVEDIEERRLCGRVRAGVDSRGSDIVEDRRDERKRAVVQDDSLSQRAGEAEDVVDREDRDVAERRRVRHNGVIPASGSADEH